MRRNLRKKDPHIVVAPLAGHSDLMGRYPISMLNSIPATLLISTALGFLSGIGVGGGSLLILWVTLILGMDHYSARILNLLFFIPSAIIASLFHWKQGRLDIKKVFPAVLAGCAGAALFSFISKQLDIGALKKCFGILLLGTGIRELFYKSNRNQRPRNAK